ncbi:MAG TPA: tetratricopeptide repeat protein [Candidatus Saccharimonadales bacterium]|nr:tetratricopeptide repeat protein [Candidatus Saccharimonadales bacterium]
MSWKDNLVESESRVAPSPVPSEAQPTPPATELRQAAAARCDSTDRALSVWLESPAVLLLLIALLTFVLYVGTLSFQFVWDDHPQIVNNPIIRTWHDAPRAFVSDLWYHSTRNQIYYRPLFTVWSMFNYSLFALKPWGWHLSAVLVHILAALAVFVLARKLGVEYWASALAALLFAIHPVHVECVAWVSSVSDSLVTLFYAAAFIAFLNSRELARSDWFIWRFASLFLAACALLTKEMGLTLCAMVAVCVWLYPQSTDRPASRIFREGVLVALPYGVLTVAYLLLRRFALHQVAGTFDPAHGFADVLLTWPLILCKYLRILVLPTGLTGLYYDPYVLTPESSRFWLSALVIGAVAAGIWYWTYRTKNRVVAFAGLWMIVTLAPTLYFRSFYNGDFVRDRYIYLPSIGFVILAAIAIRCLPSLGLVTSRSVQVAAVSLLTLGYGFGTYSQQVYWSSDLLIFARGHALYPNSAYASLGFANELSRRGAYDRAIELAESATKVQPNFGLGYLVLADLYLKTGQKEMARTLVNRGITVDPSLLKSEISKIDTAGIFGELGDYDRALSLCSQVLLQEPDLYSAQYNCGNISLLAGHYPEAESLLSKAIAADPTQANPYFFLGRVYMQTDRPGDAEKAFRHAIALSHGVYDFHLWYGRLLAQRGDAAGARREFTEALALNSGGAEAKTALANLGSAQ